MANPARRHKHVQLDQRKLSRALRAVGARTETETLDRALDALLAEAAINAALRKVGGRGKFRPIYP